MMDLKLMLMTIRVLFSKESTEGFEMQRIREEQRKGMLSGEECASLQKEAESHRETRRITEKKNPVNAGGWNNSSNLESLSCAAETHPAAEQPFEAHSAANQEEKASQNATDLSCVAATLPEESL